ncbi:hypothetical protein BYT27DRAFT_7185741 [Phlegmacium glaucopus]|nr:hypothetical protein BYT27DRAFT_7185741 [Phlegmacium glaucopus]
MIIEKQPLPEDPTPTESPPSYETLSAINRDYPRSKRSELTLVDLPSSSSSPRSPPFSPNSSPSIISSTSGSSSSNKCKGRTVNWFNFAASRTTREVRNTVLGLIRDLVQEQDSSFPAATGILQSCADACTTHSLSLSSILQEKSIENHTPLYWAIVKRLPDEHHQVEDSSGPDLLSALLSYSAPLSPATITDVRRACLATCDQHLFQRLRLSPEFAPVSGVDQMLLGGTIPPDNIEVENVPGDGGAFVVTFEILHFHKRMVVSKNIGLEFIARNRMWRLEFSIAPENGYDGCRPGSWCISLSLLETSPPTWIDSRIIIPEATPPSADHSSDHLNPPLSASSRFKLPSNASKPKPAIELKLESSEQLEAPRKGQSPKRIIVTLQDSLSGASLQYGGRLEARLGKPGPECIIC